MELCVPQLALLPLPEDRLQSPHPAASHSLHTYTTREPRHASHDTRDTMATGDENEKYESEQYEIENEKGCFVSG